MKHPFDYHKPNAEQVEQITQIRGTCKSLYEVLMNLPSCRERSVAITKLEEVSMWANKAIIMQDESHTSSVHPVSPTTEFPIKMSDGSIVAG